MSPNIVIMIGVTTPSYNNKLISDMKVYCEKQCPSRMHLALEVVLLLLGQLGVGSIGL